MINPACYLDQGVKAVVGDAIENLATAVVEAYGRAVASLGTVWVNIGTPNLTGSGSETSAIEAGTHATDSIGITRTIGYVMWTSLAVAVISLFILGALIASRIRTGEGVMAVGRVGLVLGATVLVSGSSALVSGLMPTGPNGAGGATLFLQSALWWYTGAAAMVAVIIGGARMAWEQRAEPGRETVRSLLTLVVVAGAGVTVVGLLVTAADSFAVWLLEGSLNCDVTEDGTCFGENMLTLLALSSTGVTGGLGSLLTIILGLIAVLAAAVQVVLMVARGGMLVILTGILPLSASFTNTEMGRNWFRKCVAWLVAFILYKPAAAVVYAAAFQLVGTNVFSDDGTGFLSVLTGLMLMVIALFAMPALMRFVTPMVGAMAGGAAGGAAAVGALAALPTGAAAVGRLASGSGSASQPSSAPSGANGESGAQGAAGPSGGGHGGGQAAGAGAQDQSRSSGASQSGRSGAPGAGTGAGTTPGTGSAAASAGSGAGSGAAAGSGGAAAAGGAAGSGAAAGSGGAAAAGGAAGGPVGVAAGAALEAGKKAGQAAAGAVRAVGEQTTGQATGEEGGPSGSR
ncbi:hypothetical protein D5R93_07615 [Actinomyces lilanjuaniae]|uniref:Epstein-Barr nuclear antigen 1 (EBV nuclear antigen 1) (EBNA-1) n=2 Tax=Actinomyces lilanjuaniae TaxID=2321394 RepID=A0ABN5PR90_9ACTO|nr:hypothetical protein D5R93_07615 [Actinomyces lilanjuaniae]